MGAVLSVDLPEDVWAALEAAGYTAERLSEEALRHYAGVLYARKALTLEQAARLANLALWDFIPFLGEQGVSVSDYDAGETETELETARWLMSAPPE